MNNHGIYSNRPFSEEPIYFPNSGNYQNNGINGPNPYSDCIDIFSNDLLDASIKRAFSSPNIPASIFSGTTSNNIKAYAQEAGAKYDAFAMAGYEEFMKYGTSNVSMQFMEKEADLTTDQGKKDYNEAVKAYAAEILKLDDIDGDGKVTEEEIIKAGGTSEFFKARDFAFDENGNIIAGEGDGVLDERDYAAYAAYVDSLDGKLDGKYSFNDEGNAQTYLYSDQAVVDVVREQMSVNYNQFAGVTDKASVEVKEDAKTEVKENKEVEKTKETEAKKEAEKTKTDESKNAEQKETKTVTVKKGDNLWNIVKTNYGLKNSKDIMNKIAEIKKVNKMKDIDMIYPGDVITLP